jgi:hypothetical protein
MRFGEYLIKKGRIEESELENALKLQKEKHITLGVLALRENLLSTKQVSTILDNQRENGGLFGEIAIELGFGSYEETSDKRKVITM